MDKNMTTGDFFEDLNKMIETIKDTITEAIEAKKNPLDLEEFKKLVENWDFKSPIIRHYKDDLEPITNYLRSNFCFWAHDFYPGNEEINKCPSDEWVFENKDGITFYFEVCPKHKTFLLYVRGEEK